MKPAFPPQAKARVVRPAIIAIRFTGPDTPDSAFRKAVKLYQTILETEPLAGEEKDYRYYSFPVGLKAKLKKKDIELRLELRATDDTPLKNRTVVYWEIRPAKSAEAVRQIKEDLRKMGYDKLLDNPTLAAEDNFVVGDDSDYLFGGSPNVNFPPHLWKQTGGLLPSASPVAGLLLGLALGPLLLGVLGLLRGSRR